MDNDAIFLEVIPSEVLTYKELALVSESRRTGQVQPELTTICNVIKKRSCPMVKSELIVEEFVKRGYKNTRGSSEFTLTTREATIELCSVRCSYNDPDCNYILSIRRDTDTIATFKGELRAWGRIPVDVDGENVQLSPNTSYRFRFECSCHYFHRVNIVLPRMSGNHFSVDSQTQVIHIGEISYITITKKVRST